MPAAELKALYINAYEPLELCYLIERDNVLPAYPVATRLVRAPVSLFTKPACPASPSYRLENKISIYKCLIAIL